MAGRVSSERPVRQSPRGRMATVSWVPGHGSNAQMRAQSEALRSIRRFVTAVKAERERVTREGRNSED